MIRISKYKLFIFVFSFLILTRFSFDPDLGWHLAIGNKFLESGEIIRGDPFSWTMPGYVFGNYFFGYQILVAFLFKNLGYVLTTMVFGLIASLAVILLLPKALDFIKTAAVFLGLGVAANLGVRPNTISFLCFAVLLVLLDKKFFIRPIHAVFWFVFFIIWANFHQGFFVGIFTLGIFVILDFLWQINNIKRKSKDVYLKGRILTVFAAILGGLLTPFHGHVWGSALNDLFGSKTWSSIAEWQPIVIYLPWSLLYGISGLVFAYILFRKFRELEPVWLLLAAFIFMLPFLTSTVVFFWAVIFIFIASRHLEIRLDIKGSFMAKVPIVFSVSAVSIAIFLAFLLGLADSLNLDSRLSRDGYPVAAVDFMKKNGITQGVFNSYGWGGYIDWQAPEIKVFIDGRMTGWRSDEGYILADYVGILGGDCDVASKYDIRAVLMDETFSDKCFPDFREVYRDSKAKILVKG